MTSLEELEKFSDEDLRKKYDAIANLTVETPSVYLNYLHWRHQNRQTEAMLKYTLQIKKYTVIITIATIIAFVISIWATLR